jgi:deoxyribodipyrimidine photo-lyase
MEESTYEEARVDAAVRSSISGRAKLKTIWGHTLFHIEDLPFSEDLSDLPDVFTPFRNKVESKCVVRKVVPAPKIGDLPLPKELSGIADQGGVAVWDRLPLCEGVKANGPPKAPVNAVLDFKVRREDSV